MASRFRISVLLNAAISVPFVDGQGSNLALSDEGVEPVIESATLISMDEERPHPDDSDGSCHLTQESEERGRICQSNADLSSLAVEVGLDHDEFDEDAQDPVGLNESVDGTSGSDGQTSAQERTKNISASNGNPDPDSGKGDDSVAGESDNVSDEDEERNPRKRRRTTQLIDGRTQASNSRPSCDITADANAASSSTNTKATVPVTASAPASAPTDAKIRVFLPVCETRIDVRLSLTLLQVVRWEQAKKRKEAESRGLRYRATEVAAAWVHRVPMPLSRTFDELTEGSMRVKWEVAVEPIPIASTWGMEVCRRTLILAISLAASRIRGSNPSLGILSVRATTAHGIYLSMASSLREADLRKVASALRAALTEVVSSAVPTRTRKLAALEAAAYFSRQGLVLSETMVLSKNRLVLTCDTVGDSAVALVHGSYTSVLLPSLSDLRDASIGVYPIATSSGLFVKFASPGSQQLPFGDVEERALLVAIGELDDQSRLLQVGNVAKLNDIVGMGEYACKRHIELAEAQLGRRLGAFAERVLANRPRLIMISAPPCGGVEWLAHALELQLRLRELRGVCINAAHWARPAGVLHIAEMLADLGTLFATGKVQLRGLLRDDGSMGAPSCVDLPAGGYVILYGEQLQDGLQMATENPNPLRDLPAPQFRVQAMPLCCVAIDEHACIGGGSFLLLRLLAKAFADGKCVVTALRVWVSKRSIQRERALEHIDLTLVGSAMSDEWKPLNLSFAYELSLYAQLLSPALKSIPFGDEVSFIECLARVHRAMVIIVPTLLHLLLVQVYSEARHLLDMLSEFRGMPLDYVPLQSLVRSFCGGAWLPIR